MPPRFWNPKYLAGLCLPNFLRWWDTVPFAWDGFVEVDRGRGPRDKRGEAPPDKLLIESLAIKLFSDYPYLPAMLAQEFLACNPKKYDGKGGDVVRSHWIEKMESVHDMSGCSIDEKVKYIVGSFVVKALMWWNSQISTLSREVASWYGLAMLRILIGFMTLARYVFTFTMALLQQISGMVPLAAIEPKTIQKVVQISLALTDEAVRNGSIKKDEKRGNVGEPSKDKNVRDDNKRR
ncbi:hypothetical protein Tco_0721720 [Tanacetum coccineum]